MKDNHEFPQGSSLPEKLSKPALRALAGAGIDHLEQLSSYTEADLLKLHGMGQKGIEMIAAALADKGLDFKK
jgi:DNA-directed RNA polymerase alpha subunit